MPYADYVKTISSRVSAALDEIFAGYNFSYGIEFEIALCRVLRKVLPEKYGVCRGFIIDKNGARAGDDIIVYDRGRFPTLRILGENTFERHECIPFEAVYAYIEAKHTLTLSGEGNTFDKAFEQIKAVRALVRDDVTIGNSCDPYITNNTVVIKSGRENWPSMLNLIFCAIISRNIAEKVGESLIDDADVGLALMRKAHIARETTESKPDLIVGGKKNVMLPSVEEKGSLILHSPFFVPGKTTFSHMKLGTDIDAFAVGICSMLYALDTIRLGRLPWSQIIGASLGLET